MQKIITFLLIISSFFCFSQERKALYLKGNALFAPIGVINAGLEYQLSENYTLQGDVLISPWRSFTGKHAQIYFGVIEGRYYFKEAFKKWYVGANAGSGVFDITKYNYFGTDLFQRGFTFTFGATVGYQFQWKERWNIDLFLGGGTVQSFYHGYESVPPNIFRYEDANGWNKSGEFLPYRGGIMVSYKLR